MVLKRFFMTALGAIGLGSFAAGPAFADDDQIPAPRLYGDISSCSGGMLPTSPTAMGSMSILNVAIDVDDLTDTAADIDLTDATGEGRLIGLLTPDDDINCTTNPLAVNYDRAVTLYNAYVTAKGNLPAAGADPDADATAAYNAAKADKDGFGGAVFDEVYNQQMKLKSVRDAVKAYNDLVGAGGDLATLKTSYDAYVVNTFGTLAADGSALIGDALTAELNRVHGSMGVRGYQALRGNDDDGATAVINEATADGAFNAAGELVFANTGASALVGSTSIDTLGEIHADLNRWTAAVKSDQDALDAAVKVGNTNLDPLREALRKTTSARDHVQSELNRLLAIARAENRSLGTAVTLGTGTNTRTFSDERSVINEYGRVQGRVNSAASSVRSTVTALENANKALQNSLKDPDDYLSQLVRLREFEQAKAQKDVNDNGGADAANSLKQRLEDANKALAAAKKQYMSHMDLTEGSGTPASTLLNALLESDMGADGNPNPADDDGLALVNAISDTYDTAKDAKDTADMAMESVEGLAGDDGAVAQNAMNIQENTNSITELDGRVSANEAEIGMDENGMSRIDHNEARSMANAGKIMMNAENIVTNAGNIAANASEIVRVEGRVDSNWDAIAANQTAISGNTAAIGMNTSAIADNAAAIGSNRSSIMQNADMIGGLQDQMEVVRAGVAASMALAGMPAINGRGISIGVGSFDGESAFAVGFQIQGEMASFKVGVTSAGGETGASAGVGFQF